MRACSHISQRRPTHASHLSLSRSFSFFPVRNSAQYGFPPLALLIVDLVGATSQAPLARKLSSSGLREMEAAQEAAREAGAARRNSIGSNGSGGGGGGAGGAAGGSSAGGGGGSGGGVFGSSPSAGEGLRLPRGVLGAASPPLPPAMPPPRPPAQHACNGA
jgi:hypothetical protein